MKLALDTDFTRLPRAGEVRRAGEASGPEPALRARLAHDERHLRRRAVGLEDGGRILVDLPDTVALEHGDRLVLEDGREVAILAAEEELHDIRARDPVHLTELAWHIGNRHLAAAIGPDRILILRDHVIKAMLEGLGATVVETIEPFRPVRGAYSGHGHAHGHDHHGQDDHADRDRFGRSPDDPHYGHNHA